MTAGLLTLALAVAAATAQWLLGLGDAFSYRVTGLFVGMSIVVGVLASRALGSHAFGPANRVTLTRVALTVLIAGFVFERPDFRAAWLVIVLTIVGLVLDGFDGRLARRSGQATRFGARFDMETDAALVMILAVLCWQFGKAGVWILATGLMRYAFVAAAAALPWMRRPLPYSRRRQAVCVWQISGLLAVLSPLFPVPASSVVGVLTLALVSASFGVDIAWLARERKVGDRARGDGR